MFLSEIDRYRFFKYYFLPLCRKLLNVQSDDELLKGCPQVTTAVTKSFLGSIVLGLAGRGGQPRHIYLSGSTLRPANEMLDLEGALLALFRLDFSDVIADIRSGKLQVDNELLRDILPDHSPRGTPGMITEVPVLQLIDKKYLTDELALVAKTMIERVYKVWKNAYSFVGKEEEFDITSPVIV